MKLPCSLALPAALLFAACAGPFDTEGQGASHARSRGSAEADDTDETPAKTASTKGAAAADAIPAGSTFGGAPGSGSGRVVGYFPAWSVYARSFQVADAPADKLTHLNYG